MRRRLAATITGTALVLATGCAGPRSIPAAADLVGTWRAADVELTLRDDGSFESTGIAFEPGTHADDPEGPGSDLDGAGAAIGNWILDDTAGPDSDGATVLLTLDAPHGPGLIPLELAVVDGSSGLRLVVDEDADPATDALRLER